MHKIPKEEWHHHKRESKNIKAGCPSTLKKFIGKSQAINETECRRNRCANRYQKRMFPSPLPDKLRVETKPSDTLPYYKKTSCDCKFIIHYVKLFPLRLALLFFCHIGLEKSSANVLFFQVEDDSCKQILLDYP